jgi:hypothetical protein
MKKLLLIAAALVAFAGTAQASTFVNGGFETGDWTGWTTGSGLWKGSPPMPVSPSYYLPGGAGYDGGVVFNQKSAIVTPGNDPIVGSLLPTVYNSSATNQHAARVNNWDNMYHVSAISQTVTNYTDPHIYFAWAAVLQDSHGATDSDYFALTLKDETTGDILYNVSYSSATTPGYFHKYGYWYYSDWQAQDLDVSARNGHDFTLSLLGSDCPYGGHGGYVYLDGFGATNPVVPEPSTVALLGLGLAGIAVMGKRMRK